VIRVLPEFIDYYKIRRAVKAVAAEFQAARRCPNVRQAFGKYAEIEHIKTLTPADLDIYKEDNQIGRCLLPIEKTRCRWLANVSLLLDFRGSSSGRGYFAMSTAFRLEQALGHTFPGSSISCNCALTHRSCSSPHNERLEFLGDAILNAVIARCLFERFPRCFPEGDLSQLRANLVCQDSLHQLALALTLGDFPASRRGGAEEWRSAAAIHSG
jgi:hypothetical protein